MSDFQTGEANDHRIELSVVHGHLAFARFPVLVGHYSGEAFAGAEARLDRALDGGLSARRRMGLYPGRIGTNLVVVKPNSKPEGAVVVGLGESIGELSVGSLRQTLRQGILAYVTDASDLAYVLGASDQNPPSTAPRLGLSSLLIGAGDGGVGRKGFVQALLQAAAEANTILGKLVRLGGLEIIELYEDRAVETWRMAKRTIESDSNLKASFALAAYKVKSGGRFRAPLERDVSRWQAIQIKMPRVERARDRYLVFTARGETEAIPANISIAAPVLRRVDRNIDLDGSSTSPGRILFELLWPDSLKRQSAEEHNRRLVLDQGSAAFPWELLDDRQPWTSSDIEGLPSSGPPAVRAGVVRQLLQTEVSGNAFKFAAGRPRGLVIGVPAAEPMKGFSRLPGAEAEARAVSNLLEQTHDVTLLLKAAATPEQIFKQLFGQAWEVVHISAHGVVDYEMADADGSTRNATGVVLGGGVVMGPAELSRLPISPSIFFVNCCSLGRIDESEEDRAQQESRQGRPELAASVATELVRLGVRCVIVAGWEVDDDAAEVFATTFYQEMLEGLSFGEATLRARKSTYQAKPNSNTWGAFQCYGDPDYHLRVPMARAEAGDADQFVAISEAIAAAEQIRKDVNVGLERNLTALSQWLDNIELEARNKGWLGSAQLCQALAEARTEFGDLPAAIELYSSALANNYGGVKLRAVEQLANLRSRNAVRDFRAKPKDVRDPADAIDAIRTSLHVLESLTEAVGPTSERLSLQGSCWKRLAQVQPASPAADEALQRMKQCYDAAARLGGPDADYPLLMACNAATCIAARNGTPLDPSVSEQLQRMVNQAFPDEADFWRLVRSADVRTNVALVHGPSSEDLEKIKDAYKRAWRHIGSPVKMRSVTEQLEFYEDIFSEGSSNLRRHASVSSSGLRR